MKAAFRPPEDGCRPAAAPAARRRGAAAAAGGTRGLAGPTRRTPYRPPAMARPPATARRARSAGRCPGVRREPGRERIGLGRRRTAERRVRPGGRSWWRPVAALTPGGIRGLRPSRPAPFPSGWPRRAAPTAPALPPAERAARPRSTCRRPAGTRRQLVRRRCARGRRGRRGGWELGAAAAAVAGVAGPLAAALRAEVHAHFLSYGWRTGAIVQQIRNPWHYRVIAPETPWISHGDPGRAFTGGDAG